MSGREEPSSIRKINSFLKNESTMEAFSSLVFLIVLIVLIGLNITLTMSFNLVILMVIIVLSISGYLITLNEELSSQIFSRLSIIRKNRSVRILVVPLITMMILVLSFFMENDAKAYQGNAFFVFQLYLLYVIVPVIIAEGIVAEPAFLFKSIGTIQKQVIRFGMGFFIILWMWWFIEFDWIPSLIDGFPVEKFLGLLAASWSFFVILDHHVPRRVTSYLTVDSFRVIGMWTIILIIIIVPAALYSDFIRFGINEVLEQGMTGLIVAFLLFLGIFFITGIIEEFVFRGLIFHWAVEHLDLKELPLNARNHLLLSLFAFAAFLIFLTPHLGLANYITSGPFKHLPPKLVYSVLAIIYLAIGILLIYSDGISTEVIVLVWSSMVFGWAHFEDWRYLIFATIAGIGYGETYRRTKNLFAAATLHALVDFIWGMIFAG